MLAEFRKKLDQGTDAKALPLLNQAIHEGRVLPAVGHTAEASFRMGIAMIIGGVERIVHPLDVAWRTDDLGYQHPQSVEDLDFLAPMIVGALRIPVGAGVAIGGSFVGSGVNAVRAAIHHIS
jgi:hypothetical protein